MLNENAVERGARLTLARQALGAGVILGFYSEPATPEELVLIEEERARNRDRVEAALASLDEVDRRLLRACFWEDLSLAEAARRVGLEYDQARYRFNLAMASVWRKLRAA